MVYFALMNKDEKRQLIYDFGKYIERIVYVEFVGGREVIGKLVNFDSLQNLVLIDPKNGSFWNYGAYLLCFSHSITTVSLGAPKQPKKMS